MLGLTTKEDEVRSSVYPSGLDLATASAPMMPFAPGRLSTTKGCPVRAASAWAISLATVSLPPAPNGTTTRTRRLGYASQNALDGQSVQHVRHKARIARDTEVSC